MMRETSRPISRRSAEAVASLAGALAATAALLSACGPSAPQIRAPAYQPVQQSGAHGAPVSNLRPGGAPARPPDPRDAYYEGNRDAIYAGQRWFQWYNCSGCHFHGGGGIGPALMDKKWRYGSRLDQIYHSIADGRPNGMPAWRGKIPASQIWQLAAYVKSLSSPESLQQNAQPKTPLDPANGAGFHQEPRFVRP
jgi:cytochrome c oxidase cbb3-type subunit 3